MAIAVTQQGQQAARCVAVCCRGTSCATLTVTTDFTEPRPPCLPPLLLPLLVPPPPPGATELAQLFKNLGMPMSYEKVADVFMRYDKDESGQIDFGEWLLMFQVGY